MKELYKIFEKHKFDEIQSQAIIEYLRQQQIKHIDEKIKIWQFLHDKFLENNIKGRFSIDIRIKDLQNQIYILEKQ